MNYPNPENFKDQAEADACQAKNGEAPKAVRNARAPLDFVPGEDARQRAARLKNCHDIVE